MDPSWFTGLPFLLFFLFSFYIFIGVQLPYNIVLISAVQQSESVMRMHVYSFLGPFSL